MIEPTGKSAFPAGSYRTNGNGATNGDGGGAHVPPWALDMVYAQHDDVSLPRHISGINVVLNRARLANWLTEFGDDADVRDFILLDVLTVSLGVNLSSTGLAESTPSLSARPFRLWEYVWLYKILGLGDGKKRVLDLGGTATHLTFMAALAGNQVESIDVNPEFVLAGSEAARALGIQRYAARVADMTDLGAYASESFDVVMSASVLEHLTAEQQRTSLREVARVLKPGGVLGFTFDYGEPAPDANVYLPAPHDPPRTSAELLERFAQSDLSLIGNTSIEEPVPDSLFASRDVHYTIGSIFAGRPPLATLDVPVPLTRPTTVLQNIHVEGMVHRAFRAALATSDASDGTEPVQNVAAVLDDLHVLEIVQRQAAADRAAAAAEVAETLNACEAHLGELAQLRRIADRSERLLKTSGEQWRSVYATIGEQLVVGLNHLEESRADFAARLARQRAVDATLAAVVDREPASVRDRILGTDLVVALNRLTETRGELHALSTLIDVPEIEVATRHDSFEATRDRSLGTALIAALNDLEQTQAELRFRESEPTTRVTEQPSAEQSDLPELRRVAGEELIRELNVGEAVRAEALRQRRDLHLEQVARDASRERELQAFRVASGAALIRALNAAEEAAGEVTGMHRMRHADRAGVAAAAVRESTAFAARDAAIESLGVVRNAAGAALVRAINAAEEARGRLRSLSLREIALEGQLALSFAQGRQRMSEIAALFNEREELRGEMERYRMLADAGISERAQMLEQVEARESQLAISESTRAQIEAALARVTAEVEARREAAVQLDGELSRRDAELRQALVAVSSAQRRDQANAVALRSLRTALAVSEGRLNELQATEERLRSELQATEERLRSEVQVTEERLRSELQATQERLQDELQAADEARQSAEAVQTRLRENLRATSEAFHAVVNVTTQQTASLEYANAQLAAQHAAAMAEVRHNLARAVGELQAIHQETPLALMIRKALHKMPPPEALPLFSKRFAARKVKSVIKGAIRAAARAYFAASVPEVRLPKITMVTPVFNGADYVADAIRSVLAQEYPALEYIVADGGSTDGTVEIVQSFPGVTLFSQRDNGMYDALRRGFGIASGEVFGYLNADDLLEPGALRRVGEHFAKHRGSNVIYFEDIVDVEGWRFPNVAQPKNVDFARLVDGHVLFQDGVFFRRDVYHRAGGMNPDMRLAGDAELWAKLARLTRFDRKPGHVSTFRVRIGQLSAQMDRYNAERATAMAAIRKNLSLVEKLVLCLRQWGIGLRRNAWSQRRDDRLFFPIDFAQMPPPPGEIPPAPTHIVPCPFTGAPSDRLLFSSRDTRFGNALINYIYYVPETHLTTTYPPLDEAALGRLYETHYSDEHPPMVIPSGTSPYRGYAAKGMLARYALTHQVPDWLAKYAAVNWIDQSFEEMTRVLEDVAVPLKQRLTFLDVGCFDGKLLDRVRAETDWQIMGAEPNPRAAEEARRKGHEVLVAGVDEVVSRIPLASTFDVIWMGQAIEHFNDPLAAMMGLRTLLKPDGVLVLSTPNLDSAQIDMFGPTWAQWHPPYHRYIFSVTSLRAMAQRSRMMMLASRTFSHPYWSALNVWQNEHGLGAVLPHGVDLPQEVVARATQVAAWSKLLFDWRGRGDYIVGAFRKQL